MLERFLGGIGRALTRLEQKGYVNSAIEHGWLPDDLQDRVVLDIEDCARSIDQEALVLSIEGLRGQVNRFVPLNYCEPLQEPITLPQMNNRARKKELKTRLQQSSNLYEMLDLLKLSSRHDVASYKQIQDCMVDVVLKIAEIEVLRGNFDRSIKTLESVIDEGYVGWESRKNVLVRFLGHTYAAQGDYVRAECSFKETQRRNVWGLEGGYGAILYNHLLALSLIKNERMEQAILAFERVKSQLPFELGERYVSGYRRLLGKTIP